MPRGYGGYFVLLAVQGARRNYRVVARDPGCPQLLAHRRVFALDSREGEPPRQLGHASERLGAQSVNRPERRGEVGYLSRAAVQRALGRLEGELFCGAKSQCKARSERTARRKLCRNAHGHIRVRKPAERLAVDVRTKARPGGVGGQAQPAAARALARKPPYEQRPRLSFGAHAQPPIGRVSGVVLALCKRGLQLERQLAGHGFAGCELHYAHFRRVPRRDAGDDRSGQVLALAVKAQQAALEPVVKLQAALGARQRQQICLFAAGDQPQSHPRRAVHGRLKAPVDAHAPGLGVRHPRRRDEQAVNPVGKRIHLGLACRDAARRVGRDPSASLSGPLGPLKAAPVQREGALRRALGQQRRERGHGRLGHKAAAHDAVQKAVCRRDEAHAEVVRHDAAHYLSPSVGAAAGREIHRLPQPVAPAGVELRKAPQIPRRGVWSYGQGEVSGIRSVDRVLVHAALQRQRGAAVGLISVRQRGVKREKRALALAPRRAVGHIAALHVQAEPRALPEQRAALKRQKQLRHEVFEHCPRPARQPAIAVAAHERARKLPPVPHRHRPVGHGIVAREPRLAGHEVVAALAALPRTGVITYPEEPSGLVIERGEVHAVAQFQRAGGKVGAAVLGKARCNGREARGEVAAVHGGDIRGRERQLRARVVPVVEMPAPLGQRLAGRQHAVYELERSLLRRRAQICRSQGARHSQADIRRRGALGDAHWRLFLVVVRRQKAALRRAEFVEVSPNFPALVEQKAPVFPAQGRVFLHIHAQRYSKKHAEEPNYAQRLACRLA